MSKNTCVGVPPPGLATFPVAGLLAWYAVHRRPLPWRDTKDPYRIWLSEIMLQQTQVATVIPYYERFLKRFSTIVDLAAADEQEVLKAWENLGYYTRARQLHRAAKIVMEQFDGRLPPRQKDLSELPGIGAYTAGAILSIAFGQAVAAIDGNVRRVLCRFYTLGGVQTDKKGYRCLSDILTPLLPLGQTGEFNQALMELGATVCRTRRPRCENCPLGECCVARVNGCPEAFPVRREKKIVPTRNAVAAIISDGGGRVLMVKRQPGGLLGSLWKFPGGFCKEGEPPDYTLKRTLLEENGIDIREETYLALIRHTYTHFRLCLHIFACKVAKPQQAKVNNLDSRWIHPHEIKDLPLSKVDRQAAAQGGLL